MWQLLLQHQPHYDPAGGRLGHLSNRRGCLIHAGRMRQEFCLVGCASLRQDRCMQLGGHGLAGVPRVNGGRG